MVHLPDSRDSWQCHLSNSEIEKIFPGQEASLTPQWLGVIGVIVDVSDDEMMGVFATAEMVGQRRSASQRLSLSPRGERNVYF